MENEKVEPVVTELGLALGYSGYRIGRMSSSNDLGAGANAASRIDMAYMATDPLSEIVWSPRKGLCLKCTQCSFSKNKRSLVCCAGAIRSGQETTSAARSSNEKPIDEHVTCASSSTIPDLNTKVSDVENSDRSARDNDDIRSCHGPDVTKQDMTIIESLFNDPRIEVEDVGDQTRLSNMQMVLVSKVHTGNAENDLQGVSKDECVAKSKISGSESASKADSGIRGYRRKGKEKALSHGDVKGMVSKSEDDDSHESVESCNSAATFSSGKKRCGYEHRLIVGSKRVKRQMHDESSFMNWISNMMKGFVKSKDDIPSSLALTNDVNINPSHDSLDENLDAGYKDQDPGHGSIGFQSVFHSIYSPKTKICDIDATPIACHGGSRVGPSIRPKNSSMTLSPSKKSSEENVLENTNSSNLPVDVEKDRSSTSSSLGKRKMITRNVDSDSPSEAKMARNIGPKSNLLGSLWITRFTPKGSSSLCNLETMETKLQCPQEPLTTLGKELKEASIGLSILKSKDSEPTASRFARRLDTIEHVMPSGVQDSRTSSTVTCFFCGRKGHHLQYCPDITDNEIGHLLRNMKSSSRFEELPRVHVRCFEHNHWSVSCPTASRGTSTLYEVNAEKTKPNTNVNKNYVVSSSKGIERGNFIDRQISDTPKAIFDAVRMLRLSRTDILKWKNSKTSISHLRGFFLRLRLAKWEKESGGTGYYVAYITEANEQGTQRNSKKSIAVNVGGIECLVESQYISNHDFLEDELTAWLKATEKNDGKIPSEEELAVKVKERIMLGF